MDLLVRIISEGQGMLATRDALNGLSAVRHTAMSSEAYRAYLETRMLVMGDLYTAAEAWGIEGWDVVV
jgi:hypothetical protein